MFDKKIQRSLPIRAWAHERCPSGQERCLPLPFSARRCEPSFRWKYFVFLFINNKQADDPNIGFGDLGRKLGEMWHALDENEKEDYRRRARWGKTMMTKLTWH